VKERTVASRPSRSKKPKPPAWEIYRLKGAPAAFVARLKVARAAFVPRLKRASAAFVGVVYAEDEETAIAAAIQEHKVRPADQKRLFARPR
jgi:hypothetical protein